jgi:dUTP pyrophosphatase
VEPTCKTFQKEKNVTNSPISAKPDADWKTAPIRPQLEVFRLDPRAKLPRRANDGAIGFDVHAFLVSETGQPLTRTLHQRGTVAVSTGLVLRPPPGYYVQCCSRSGLAKSSVFVANSPGIIDPDYSGELIILLFNGGFETQYVKHEQRIAQLILTPAVEGEIFELPSAPPSTGRGTAGFGSTGM